MNKLERALREIGANKPARERMIEALRMIESEINYSGPIRDDISGPVLDALFQTDQKLDKRLNDGTNLSFLYRSKIAREFVLSTPVEPDHAWEPQTTKLLVHFAKRSGHALVGGAYFGDQAILMAKAMGPKRGTVHAFEPNQEQAAMLAANAKQNQLNNITIHSLALWDQVGLKMRLSGDDALAHSEIAESEEISFGTMTIDAYVENAGLPNLDLIMLDIEGGELRALAGAQTMLAKPSHQAPVVVFEMHAAYVDWSEGLVRTPVIQLLTSHGYSVYAVRDYNANEDMRGMPIELVPANDCYLAGPVHGFNMLAVKNPNLIDELFRITPAVSPKLLRHKDPAIHQPLHRN